MKNSSWIIEPACEEKPATVSINAAIAERQVTDKILLCNEDTEKYGLTLTERQAFALAQTRTISLRDNKRIEFGDGIEFMEKYLRCLEAENAFCIQFHSRDIHQLLCGLAQDYRNIPMNLFEYVVLSAFGLVLLNRSPQKLDLSKEDLESLYFLFSDKSDEKIIRYLGKAVHLLSEHSLLPKSTGQYLEVTLQKFVSVIGNAVK